MYVYGKKLTGPKFNRGKRIILTTNSLKIVFLTGLQTLNCN